MQEVELRQGELAGPAVPGNRPRALRERPSPVIAAGAKIKKETGGFFSISGGVIDRSGDLYFVDAKWQTIYRWSATARKLSIVRDNPIDPVELAFDKAGDLLVISYAGDGTVYSFKPDAPNDDITLLKAEPAAPRPGMTPVLPADYWQNENDSIETESLKKPYQFVSPDGTPFIPPGTKFVSGQLYYAARLED